MKAGHRSEGPLAEPAAVRRQVRRRRRAGVQGEGDRQVRLRRAARGVARDRQVHDRDPARSRRPTTCLSDLTTQASAAVAREVIEAYGDGSGWAMANPVGTGPYRIKEWRRGQKIVLEANPGFRDVAYPQSADPADREIVARMGGKKLPLIGRVEISIIEESNPRLLAFEKGDLDYVTVPPELTWNVLDHHDQRNSRYAIAGVQLARGILPTISYTYFNMEDPVVGGYTKDKVALRRAVSMAYNVDEEIRVVRQGQAMPATQPVPPGVTGHDPTFNGHVQIRSGRRAGAARQVRLRRSRQGRLARPARRPAARPAHFVDHRRARAAVGRAVAAQPQGRRHPRRIRQAEVSGYAQDGARGPVADVGARQHQHDDRGLRLSRPALRRQCGAVELLPVQPARVQPALRGVAPPARRPGAHEAVPRNVGTGDRVRAVDARRVSLRERRGLSLGRRLQVQRHLPAPMALPRHRHAR